MDPKVCLAFAALGLPTTANRTAVKAEYRRLALLHHPDKVLAGQKAQAQEDMKFLNAADETLEGYLDWKESFDMARKMEREGWERERKAEEERARRVREEREERERKVREAREREEERKRLEEARTEHTRLKQQKVEDEKWAREWEVSGREEVKKMKAAWQQQWAEAGVWLAEKKAPAGAKAVVEEEEEEISLPSNGKIRFSLRNLKK